MWCRRGFTWYLARSLLFHNACGTSWMESLRLWVLSLKLRVFGSSNNFPPICFSICSTSWTHTTHDTHKKSCKLPAKKPNLSTFVAAVNGCCRYSARLSGLLANALLCAHKWNGFFYNVFIPFPCGFFMNLNLDLPSAANFNVLAAGSLSLLITHSRT